MAAKSISFAVPESVDKLIEIYKKSHNFSEMVVKSILPELLRDCSTDSIQSGLDHLILEKSKMAARHNAEMSEIDGQIKALEEKLDIARNMESDRSQRRLLLLDRAKSFPGWFTPEGRRHFSAWSENQSNADLLAACGFTAWQDAYDFLVSQIKVISRPTSQQTNQPADEMANASRRLYDARSRIKRIIANNKWTDPERHRQAFDEWATTEDGANLLNTSGWSIDSAWKVCVVAPAEQKRQQY